MPLEEYYSHSKAGGTFTKYETPSVNGFTQSKLAKSTKIKNFWNVGVVGVMSESVMGILMASSNVSTKWFLLIFRIIQQQMKTINLNIIISSCRRIVKACSTQYNEQNIYLIFHFSNKSKN